MVFDEAGVVCPGRGPPGLLLDQAGPNEAEGWFKSAYVVRTVSSVRIEVDAPCRVVTGPALPPRRP